MGVTPGLGIQFLMISMFATLRGTGIVKPTMIIQFITVGLNILFARDAHHRLAHGQAVRRVRRGSRDHARDVVGVIISAYYFHAHEKYVSFHREQIKPVAEVWKRLIFIGLPDRSRVLRSCRSSWASCTG